jgi:Uma2 family endonuclease
MTQTGILADPRRQGDWIGYADFLESYGDEAAEWVDGRVERMSPVTVDHDRVGGWLYRVLSEYVQIRDLGSVLHDKFQMKTGPSLPGREPAILFVATEHLGRLQRTHLMGPGDLVVEVISDDSNERDRVVKFEEYRVGGVSEYWIIDPVQESFDAFVLSPDGTFVLADPTEDGVYRCSSVDGFWLRVEWLWQRPQPSVVAVLKEMGLI